MRDRASFHGASAASSVASTPSRRSWSPSQATSAVGVAVAHVVAGHVAERQERRRRRRRRGERALERRRRAGHDGRDARLDPGVRRLATTAPALGARPPLARRACTPRTSGRRATARPAPAAAAATQRRRRAVSGPSARPSSSGRFLFFFFPTVPRGFSGVGAAAFWVVMLFFFATLRVFWKIFISVCRAR